MSSPVTRRVFVTGQFTPALRAELQRLQSEQKQPLDVRASVPPFNVKTERTVNDQKVLCPVQEIMDEFNVFKVSVKAVAPDPLLHELFTLPELMEWRQTHVHRPLELGWNLFWLSKTTPSREGDGPHKYASQIIDWLRENGEDTVAQKLDTFMTDAKAQFHDGAYPTPDAWSQLLAQHLGKNWVEHLEYDDLLQHLGLSPSSLTLLHEAKDSRGTDLRHASLRWIAQAIRSNRLVIPGEDSGCTTDIVNTVMMLMCSSDDKPNHFLYFCKKMREFIQKVRTGDLSGLFMPTHLLRDGEVDDEESQALLTYLAHKLGLNSPNVAIQLQTESSARAVVVKRGDRVLSDPDCGENAKLVNAYYVTP